MRGEARGRPYDSVVALVVAVWLAGYLLGCLPVARVVAGHAGVDPTTAGSGNPGASNVYRTAGRRAGALVATGDMAKGAAAAGLGLLAGDHLLGMAAGLAAVLGHVAPANRRFRGGKGVATTGGAVAVLFPVAAAAAVATWAVLVLVTSIASVASLVGVSVAVTGIALARPPAAELALAGAMATVVVARHRENIRALANGRERRLWGRAGRRAPHRHSGPGPAPQLPDEAVITTDARPFRAARRESPSSRGPKMSMMGRTAPSPTATTHLPIEPGADQR